MQNPKLNFTEEQLLKAYKKEVDQIAEDLEDKSHFTMEECVNICYRIATKLQREKAAKKNNKSRSKK